MELTPFERWLYARTMQGSRNARVPKTWREPAPHCSADPEVRARRRRDKNALQAKKAKRKASRR